MATYINGVTDYIPKLQPFQPDLNFYNAVLSTKEAQYQAGYDKISQLYSTLLNSPMLREPDIAKRDKYFKDIHQEIQRMSMVDLSLPQNVSQASQVFQPLLDDKNIVSDIAYTKKWNSERQYAESLRNCVDTDKKKCKGWWQQGIENLNYWASDYSKTTDDEALTYDWTPRYVPYVDIGDKFGKLMKDVKFKVTSTNLTGDGRFIVEQTNGQQMILPLTSFLNGTIGNDPGVADMYKVLAENARHQWVNSNIQNYNNDPGATEDAYNILLQGELKGIKNHKDNISTAKKTIDAKVNVVKQKIDQMPNGVSEDNELLKTLKVLLDEQAVAETALSQADDAFNTVSRSGMFTEDRMAKRKALDYGLGYQLMQRGMFDLAAAYAQNTSQTKLKVNQYKLNAEKHENAIALAKLKSFLDTERDALKHKYKMEEKGKTLPTTIPNTYSPNKSSQVIAGAATEANDVLGLQFKATRQLAAKRTDYETNAVTQFYNDLSNAADNEPDPVKQKYAVAQLTQIFGDEKGSDGSYSTRQIKNPQKYYYQVVALSMDKVYNTTFPGFSKKISQDIQNREIENQAIAAYNKTTQSNIESLFNYLETVSDNVKNSSAEDIAKMKAVIDEKTGMTRKVEDVLDKLIASGFNVDLEEANDIRLKYTTIFRKHYGEGYTLGDNKTPVVKPYDWRPGEPINVGGTAAYPATAMVGTNNTDVNQATIDALVMYDWMKKNASSDNYKIYKGLGVTSKQKDEAKKPEETNPENNFIEYALNTLRKEINLKPSQQKLSEGLTVTLHPIIMNNKDMRGFSINIPEKLFNNWKKDYGKGAGNLYKYDDYSSFTIVMPEDKAPADLFSRFNPKPIRAILSNGGTVKINHPDGGNLKLYGNEDGSVGISGNVKWIGEDGLPKEGPANTRGMNPFVDPDYLYSKLSAEIQQLGEKNLEMLMSPYNPINVGDITSGEQAEAYLKAKQVIQSQ